MRGLFESLYSCGNTSILLVDVTNISHLLLPFQNQTQFCGFACALYLSCRYGQTISNSCITNYFNGVHWKQELERRLFYIYCVWMLLEKNVDIFYFFRRFFFKEKQEVGAYTNISQINYSLKTQQLLCFYLFCTSHFLLKDPPHTHSK